MSFHHKNLRLCVQFCIICHCGHRSHFLFPTTSYIRLKQEITEITRHGGVFYKREMSVNKKCHRKVIFLLINIESRHILLTIMHVNSFKKNVLGQKTSTRDCGHWVMSNFVGRNVVVYKTLLHLIRRQIILIYDIKSSTAKLLILEISAPCCK